MNCIQNLHSFNQLNWYNSTNMRWLEEKFNILRWWDHNWYRLCFYQSLAFWRSIVISNINPTKCWLRVALCNGIPCAMSNSKGFEPFKINYKWHALYLLTARRSASTRKFWSSVSFRLFKSKAWQRPYQRL